MRTESRPNSDYTRTWSPSGEIECTQLDHFQLVIPKIAHAFTIYAIDMPGMGWSDITPGARYTEPALRRAIVEFVKTLDLNDVTLAGESMGATLSLTAATSKN